MMSAHPRHVPVLCPVHGRPEYSISNRVPATSQNLRAVCRLAFLLLFIDCIVEPSRKEEASSTELQRAWSRNLRMNRQTTFTIST